MVLLINGDIAKQIKKTLAPLIFDAINTGQINRVEEGISRQVGQWEWVAA